MGILDGIVEWIAEQVMNGLDLLSVSVLGSLGCDMFHAEQKTDRQMIAPLRWIF